MLNVFHNLDAQSVGSRGSIWASLLTVIAMASQSIAMPCPPVALPIPSEPGYVYSVVADGGVVAAPVQLGESGEGGVMLFERSACGCDWDVAAVIEPPAVPGLGLGWRLDLSGDTLIAGVHASVADGAVAWVYRRVDGEWAFFDEVRPTNASASNSFGERLVASESFVAVADKEDNWGGSCAWCGAVTVYPIGQGGLDPGFQITAHDAIPGNGDCWDWFGSEADARGDLLAIARPAGGFFSCQPGSMYVYRISSDGAAFEGRHDGAVRFPESLAVADDVIVGSGTAYGDPVAVSLANVSGSWTPTHEWDGNTMPEVADLGGAVAVDGNWLIMGGYVPPSTAPVYVFRRDQRSGWIQQPSLFSPSGDPTSFFGIKLAVTDGYGIVTDFNKAWVFCLDDSGCEAAPSGDVNGDGETNASDLLHVLAGWGDCEGCPADLDGDGIVGVNDLLLVVGCWG